MLIDTYLLLSDALYLLYLTPFTLSFAVLGLTRRPAECAAGVPPPPGLV